MIRRLFILIIVVVVVGLGYIFFNKPSSAPQNQVVLNIQPQTGTQDALHENVTSVLPTTAQTPTVVSLSNIAEPQIDAASWFLYDVNSSQIIGQNNPDLRIEPASLTKLMTASLVFSALQEGRLKLDQVVTVTPQARAAVGSRMFIEVNTPVSIADLLQGMIVQSGNDATIQLAQAVSGSVDVFVNEMNKRAHVFGMSQTHFAGPAGLPSPDTYTTARDLAVLSEHIVKDFPQYFHYFSQLEFTYNKIRQQNRNGLLRRNIGVDGLKTGHTSTAGYNLIATAKRDGRRLIAIVTGTKSFAARERGNEQLLNWGFQNFNSKVVAEANQPILEPRVWEGNTKTVKLGSRRQVAVTVPRGQEGAVQAMTQINQKLVAPLVSGQVVGAVQFILNGKIIKQDPLVVLESVEPAGFFGRMWDKLMSAF